MARSGLARRTALGTATLLVGANLPDVDVLAYLWGPAADLAFRRGWTHGVLALALWPFVLTSAMLVTHRAIRRWGPSPDGPPISPRELLLLSTISVVSHPVLDTLNTYGVRWLMPFSGRWFYGDVLFIVDPWLWLMLGMGILLSRHSTRPARVSLGLAAAYTVAMAVSAATARREARREIVQHTGESVTGLMLSPVPVTPFRRTIVAAQGDHYRVGRFRWLTAPRISPDSLRTVTRGDPDDPVVAAASRTTVGRRFLSWARFPSFRAESRGPDRYVVHIVDLRYADRPGVSFGAVSIPITHPRASAAPK